MSEPYLILHKVRGEPAFDIAIRYNDIGTPSDPGPWWIIPTSGHRAYPYWINDLEEYTTEGGQRPFEAISTNNMPNLWPDHYAASEKRSMLATAASDILSIMGLGKAKPQATVKRRVIP